MSQEIVKSISLGDGHPGPALSALLDGELSPGEESQVQAHLVGCGPCRTELDEVRLARSWVRALPPVNPPFGFLERLVLPFKPSRRRAAVASVGAVAAIMATVLGVTPKTTHDTPGAGNLANATVSTVVTTLVANPPATLVSARSVAGADQLFEPLMPAERPTTTKP